MKVATFVVIALFALSSVAFGFLGQAMPDKEIQIDDPGKPDGREGGETIADAWFIYYLPFTDTGNTCDNINNYDEVCPFTGSTSPDVVYAYEAPYDMCVSISLCNSYYDTKLYVYEDTWTPGAPYACNDDSYDCPNPPVSYISWLPEVALTAGHVYYIVIDGYGGACGDYVLEMTEVDCTPPCDVICTGIDEGEPDCYYNYDDTYNAGCNSTPESYVVHPINPGAVTYCGTGGVYGTDLGTYRDTDWFKIFPCGGYPITITVEAEFGVLFGFVDISDCTAPAWIGTYAVQPECTPYSLTEYLPYGPVAIVVIAEDWLPEYECGEEWELTIEGYDQHCDPTPVEETTWGAVKALYR